MWLSPQAVDSSQLISLITMHLFVMMCILLHSAMSNSLAEEQFGPMVGSQQEQVSNSKEVQPEDQQAIDVQSKPDGGEDKCWLTEEYDTKGPCEPCNDLMMKHSKYCCGETGFRQKVYCKSSGKETFKSCPRSRWSIERGFWTFEGVMLALGMCSGIVALMRRRKLDWKALERVRKQIANSV